jgi:multidrug efflux pump subunit AcrA (membrane-fusion protein)
MIGIGNALDETGSMMADALLLEPVDWPVGVSLRVLLPASSATLDLPLSSVWWDSEGGANVWAVSPAGRVYEQKVALGRTLGEKVEIYSGLVRGDRYIVKPVSGIVPDMLIDDIPSQKVDDEGGVTAPKTGHEGMPGMEM